MQHSKPFSLATEEFLDGISPVSVKCPQLQVFLHRKREGSNATGHEFLMVTDCSFGKVKILDISVEEPEIIIEFRDCAVDQVGNIRINVCDPSPRVLFISWRDVREMVIAEINHKSEPDDLLEFEF